MPPEDRIQSDDGGQLLKHLASEDLTYDGQAPTLVVVKEDSPFSEFLSEDPVLRQEVVDGLLLSTIDPAREDQEQ